MPVILSHSFEPGADNQSGAALVTLLIAMTVLAVIAATLLSLHSSALFHEVVISQQQRAYYLAESGYRYAAQQFVHGGSRAADREAALEALSGKILTLEKNLGRIELKVCPYFFQLSSNPQGGKTIQARVPGQFPHAWKLPREAFLFIDEVLYRYRSYSQHQTKITFSLDHGKLPSMAPGTTVQLACAVSSSTPSRVSRKASDYIILAKNGGAAFPPMNGTFRVSTDPDRKTYGYRVRTGDRLDAVYNLEKPDDSLDLEIEPQSRIILQKFIELHSTGYVGASKDTAVSRELTYYVPIAAAPTDQSPPGAGKVIFDKMDSMANWTAALPDGSWGRFAADSNEGALRITATGGSNVRRAAVGYRDFFKEEWLRQGQKLSYGAQVKVRAYDMNRSLHLNEFAAGLLFRLDPSGGSRARSFGVSFLKAGGYQGLPPSLIPPWGGQCADSDLYVILWRALSDRDYELLAFKNLGPASGLLTHPASYFSDNMEDGRRNWQIKGAWDLTYWDYHSPYQCWTVRPGDYYHPNEKANLSSRRIDLSSARSAVLTFWHRRDIRKDHARGVVRISRDDGRSWQRIAVYTGTAGWQRQTLPLDAEYLTRNFRLQFVFRSDDHGRTGEGWFIDDVAIQTPAHLVDWSTLMVRIDEKVLRSSDDPSYQFPVGSRVNDIRVYVATPGRHGTPDSNPCDPDRLGNPRGQAQWPPQKTADTTAANDFFTLIQWDAVVYDDGVELTGSGKEWLSVIRTSYLTTRSFADHRPEIGLHGFGPQAAGNIYFDDFAIKLPDSGNADGKIGFLPPVQQ